MDLNEGKLVRMVGGLCLAFLLAPQLVVALASLDPGPFFVFPPTQLSTFWYEQILSSPEWRDSILLTLQIALVASVGSAVIGSLAGIGIARSTPRVRTALYPLVVAPVIVPVIVLAISYYGIVLRLDLAGNLVAFATANMMLSAPIVTLMVIGATMRVDPRVEMASLSLGASRTRTLYMVTLRLVGPTVLAGGALAFLLALDEVVVSLFITAPGRTPLSVRMFTELQTGTAPIVTAGSSMLILASVVITGLVAIIWHLTNRSDDRGLMDQLIDRNPG